MYDLRFIIALPENQEYFYKISFLLTLFLISSCQPKQVEITPAFYHWQTNLALSDTEEKYIADLEIKKIYPKFFDVDWDFNQQAAIALAPISVATELPRELTIIPTVFITNRTLVQISINELPDLADKIAQKLMDQFVLFPTHSIQEIQFDCDWTQSTKLKYFELLNLLNQAFTPKAIDLSATIRLHQIKYAQRTGIPPVKRGMLMYYNMGAVQKETTQNSILDNEIGGKYVSQLPAYPLPLDIALPLFQWGVLFRKDKMIKLLNQLSETALVDSQRFAKRDSNHWEVIKSTYLNGVYLYKGDKIRLEKVEQVDLVAAANLLQENLKKDNRTIVFYHLDSVVIRSYEIEKLGQILTTFEE